MSDEIQARKLRFVQNITEHVMRQRGDKGTDTLSPIEIGQLEKRAIVLVKVYISNTVRLYQQNTHVSVAPAVLAAITFYSDNMGGYAWISVVTLGKLFNRHPRKIYEALAQLKELGLIEIEGQPGLTSKRWPVCPRAIAADLQASLAWVVEAFVGPRLRPGRPTITYAEERQRSSEIPLPPSARNSCRIPAPNITKYDFAKVSVAPPQHTRRPMTSDWQPAAEIVTRAKAYLVVTDAQVAAKADKLRSRYLGSHRLANWDVELWDWLTKDYAEKQHQVPPTAGSHSAQRTWMRSLRDLGPVGWPADVGPQPGQPGCRVAPDILAEFGYAGSKGGKTE